MSDDGDCCYPIRDTPPPGAQAMTREDVDRAFIGLLNEKHIKGSIGVVKTLMLLLDNDRTQRETITRLEAKVKDLEVNQVIPCLPEHAFEIAQLQASLTASEAKYHELIMAVGNKYPDETRHQTALRYIRQSEQIQGPLTPGEE